jgi:hypothetical protein
MTLKPRFLNPITIAVSVILLIVVVLVLSFSPASYALPNVSQTSGSFGGEDMVYALAATQPAPADLERNADGYYAAPGVAPDDVSITNPQEAQQPSQTRVILKSASLRLVVDAAESSLASIVSMAEEMGGWVVTSSTNMVTTPAGQQVAQGSITIRVPSDKLDQALTQIKSGAGKVEYENISGQDVTQDYVDLTSRLTNLEAAETQLRSIMEDARRTEDVLTVYTQLVSTRGEIERIRGQLQYYEEASAYSSISVDLIPTAIETPIQIAGWSPGRTVENALASLVNILQGAADLLITVVVLVIPLALVVLLPLWFIRRSLRRRAARATNPA